MHIERENKMFLYGIPTHYTFTSVAKYDQVILPSIDHLEITRKFSHSSYSQLVSSWMKEDVQKQLTVAQLRYGILKTLVEYVIILNQDV